MNIPQSVEAVVPKCMAKKPTDRFGSMRELEQALTHEGSSSSSRWTSGGTTMMVRPHPAPKSSLGRRLLGFGLAGAAIISALGLLIHLVPLRVSVINLRI